MKLYHATALKNVADILCNGIRPNLSTALCNDDARLNKVAVFGFASLDDARDWAAYDCNLEDQVAVFSFEVEDAVQDPEYPDGNSWAVVTSASISAVLEYRGDN